MRRDAWQCVLLLCVELCVDLCYVVVMLCRCVLCVAVMMFGILLGLLLVLLARHCCSWRAAAVVVVGLMVLGRGKAAARWRARHPGDALVVKIGTLLDLCASSLRRGDANLLCTVPTSADDPRREPVWLAGGVLRR